MQIAEDHAALVDGIHRLADSREHPERPLRVCGHGLRRRIRMRERIPVHDETLQRVAVDELHDQEVVPAEGEIVAHCGHGRQPGQAPQDVPLVRHPGHRVPAGDVEPRERTALLQHHPLPGAPDPPEIHAAAIGELHDALDVVGQARDRHGVPGLQVRLEELGQADPGRTGEDRPAYVGNEPSLIILDRQNPLTARVHAMTFREGPVPDEERAVAVPQVAENVRTVDAAQRAVQLLQDELQLVGIGRIDGHELAARSAKGGLGVEHHHDRSAAEELEGQSAGDAVVPNGVQYAVGVLQVGRDVDLPALRRERLLTRCVVQPDVRRLVFPAIRDRPRRDGEVRATGVRVGGRVVKGLVSQAVELILVDHRTLP